VLQSLPATSQPPDALQGETMKHLMTALALSCFAIAGAHAADAASAPATGAKPKTAQQEKMGACATEAKGKKGDEYKAAMKECLGAKKMTQQDKMKACNADPKAKATKGDERKAFMKECLSK
jgi:hypothetical protein